MAADETIGDKITNGVNGVVEKVKSTTQLYTVPAIINNKDVTFSSTFDVVSPATGKTIHTCASASVPDAISAVDAAEAAFKSWRDTPPGAKRDVFLRAAEILARRGDETGQYMFDETGAVDMMHGGFNLPLSIDILKDVAGRISSMAGSVPKVSTPGKSALVWKEPYGVILAIAPWNAPYILGFRSIAYAIGCGNTAVLKAPEFSPRCSWAICDIFREAGLPAGVLNLIAHKPADAAAVTKALIADPRVKKINFTGSTNVGRIIAELAGKHLKPTLLELGGKAPAIVWNDADLKSAAGGCAAGAFIHSGQICMATERVLVHKDVVAEFELLFKAAVQEAWGEAAVVINEAAVKKNKSLLRDAVSKGATLVNGSLDTEESSSTRMTPIIIRDVKPGMDLFYTESFGPTVSLITVGSEDEAIAIANDTEYGLSSAVFTEDLRRGLRFAREIEAGAVHINGMTVHDEAFLPHGGMKSSGFGRFGAAGMEEWVRTKTVTWVD